MLEIRYNIQTKRVTGWWGNRHGNHHVKLKDRSWDVMTLIDIPIPKKPLDAWLFDGTALVDNPDYIEPEPLRNVLAEIDKLKAEIEKLKNEQ